ncbi:APC family permease [Anaerotignum sp.]|uniref:APC family permease n=1 Tax=Anaerotignum sp. TaxID=2039241 RepID=UPI002714BCCB|nr:APC family permease [Anaerotignum sp.]
MSDFKGNSSTVKEVGKKMGIFSVFCMATGTIVGAGVFGTIPVATGLVGTGLAWAYVFAFLTVLFRDMPNVLTTSVIPAPYAPYKHVSRLVNPSSGFLMVVYAFNYILILSSLATVFAEYIGVYIPLDPRILGIAALVIFAFITCKGAAANAAVQNVMVVLLICALLMFIYKGTPKMSSELVSISKVVAPENLSIAAFGAAVAILSQSLQGAVDCTAYTDEIKNPGKTIPICFVLSTGATLILFIAVGIVCLGILPAEKFSSVKDAAALVLSSSQILYFIIAGAVFAILTSLNGIYIASAHKIAAAAEDKVLPAWFANKNKANVSSHSVIVFAAGASAIVAFGLPIGTLFSAFSFLVILCGMFILIPTTRVHKAYPHSYKHSYFKLTPSIIKVVCTLGFFISIWTLISLIQTLDAMITIVIAVWIALFYLYFFLRKAYLKKQGIDLYELMSTPYPAWVEQEAKYAAMDAAEKQQK